MNIFGLFVVAVLITAEEFTLSKWINDVEKAYMYAKNKKMIVVLYFYSESCPHCYHMETFVLGDKDVEEYAKNRFVFVPVDYDEDIDMSDKFGVYGTPTFVFINPYSGKVIGHIFGSREKEDFISILRDICNKSKILRRC